MDAAKAHADQYRANNRGISQAANRALIAANKMGIPISEDEQEARNKAAREKKLLILGGQSMDEWATSWQVALQDMPTTGDFEVSGPQFVTYVYNTSQNEKADEVSHCIELVLCNTTPDMTWANSHSGS